MTSNGTLINQEIAQKLKKCGMRTVSISVDGLPETHDAFRGKKGAFELTMNGIDALINNGGFNHVQITTVIGRNNIHELDALFEMFDKIDIDSWRIINIEPIGRALSHPEILLRNEDYKTLFGFIKNKRDNGYPVTYGCSHFLGAELEREVRKWYFFCNAGIYTASVTANGDIVSCLDIERRPELIQGNILKDDFTDIWNNKFEIFRKDLSDRNEECQNCNECEFCHGGAFHTWNFDEDRQRICFKNILF